MDVDCGNCTICADCAVNVHFIISQALDTFFACFEKTTSLILRRQFGRSANGGRGREEGSTF